MYSPSINKKGDHEDRPYEPNRALYRTETGNLLMRIFPILLLLPFLYSGCSGNPRMTDEQFVAFFVAMSQTTSQYAAAPVQLREAHERLYREYETTPETVQATIAHYQAHPEKWVPILEQIGEELKRSEKKNRGDEEIKKTGRGRTRAAR